MGSNSRHGRDRHGSSSSNRGGSNRNRDGQRRGGRFQGRYHQGHHRTTLSRRWVGGKEGKGRGRWQVRTILQQGSILARLRMCWGLSVQVTCGGSWFHCRVRCGLANWASLCETHQRRRIQTSLQHPASSAGGCHHSVQPLTRPSPAKKFSTSMGVPAKGFRQLFQMGLLDDKGDII